MVRNILKQFQENLQDLHVKYVEPVIAKSRGKRLQNLLEQTETGEMIGRLFTSKAGQVCWDTSMRGQGNGYVCSEIDMKNWTHGAPKVSAYYMMMNPWRDGEKTLETFAHEVRHMSQNHVLGMVFPNKLCTAEDAMWHTRMCEADAQATAVEMLFQHYQELNAPDEYRRVIENSDYKDMHEVFCKAVEDNPDNLYNGVAKREAFDMWFKDEDPQSEYMSRKDIYDYKNAFEGIDNWFALLEQVKPNMEADRLTKADFLPLGQLGYDEQVSDTVNYFDLPGYPSIDDDYYRGGFADVVSLNIDAINADRDVLAIDLQSSASQKRRVSSQTSPVF